MADDLPPEQQPPNDEIIGRAFRWSLLVIGVLVGLLALVIYLPRGRPAAPQPPAAPNSSRTSRKALVIPRASFADVTRAAGVAFVHQNGAYGEKLLPETMGGGCAFFDFDADGDQDLLFVNSSVWPWARQGKPPLALALYRNDGSGRFVDVTRQTGLELSLYGMGAAVGDYDNDGYVDLFVTAVGRNHLFRNMGGRFVDVTATAGVAGSPEEWSTSAGWFDMDNDGDLDLFVCNYVRWSRRIDLEQDFRLVGIGRAYGPPRSFEGTFPYLYRNEGGGRFRDVSATAGVQIRNPATGVPLAKSLGLAPVDLDGDGWMDVVVANDTVQNIVFHNERNGTFKEIGAAAGIAFDTYGNARGAMGIDSADFRDDGQLAFAIGNFANEMTALYVSQGNPLQFADEAISAGIGPASRLVLTFGLFFFDYDLDGRLDLLAANGHIEDQINKVQASQHYAQPPQLFWNSGSNQEPTYVLVPPLEAGNDLVRPMVGRGATFADIDGDGDLDVLLTAAGGPPRLLRNDQRTGSHWLRLKLIGTQANRDAIGALIEVRLAGRTLRRQVMPTRSYLSQSELPVTVGLGTLRGPPNRIDGLKVIWPGGHAQVIRDVQIDRLMVIEQQR